jgi:hypothetical protein
MDYEPTANTFLKYLQANNHRISGLVLPEATDFVGFHIGLSEHTSLARRHAITWIQVAAIPEKPGSVELTMGGSGKVFTKGLEYSHPELLLDYLAKVHNPV